MDLRARRKRKLAMQRRKRSPRQASDVTAAVDCRENPGSCIVINCSISDLGTTASDTVIVRVEGVIDERFYEVGVRELVKYRN